MSFCISDGSRVRSHHALQQEMDTALARPPQHPPGIIVIPFPMADFDGDCAISLDFKYQLYSWAMGRKSPFFKHTRKQRGRK